MNLPTSDRCNPTQSPEVLVKKLLSPILLSAMVSLAQASQQPQLGSPGETAPASPAATRPGGKVQGLTPPPKAERLTLGTPVGTPAKGEQLPRVDRPESAVPNVEVSKPAAPQPVAEVSHLDEPFDTDHVLLPAVLAPQEGRFQPMVQEGEIGLVPSYHFLGMVETLAIMNKLAYSRGQDYRHGHELTYQGSLAGWTLKNVKARRGTYSNDPNAGFVAHNKKLRTVVIVLHGSINTADWFTNFTANAVRLDSTHTLPRKPGEDNNLPARTLRLPFVGYGHKGFLDKYLSCCEEVMEGVDAVLNSPDLTAEEKKDTKFYVTGHSQAAGVSQLLAMHLCLHLQKHYGPGFLNPRDNRVHAWLLASPTGLDETAVAWAEGWVGPANVVVQNTWLDLVPNANWSLNLVQFKALGTPIMQSSSDAFKRAARAHALAWQTHLDNGDFRQAFSGMLYGANPWYMIQGVLQAANSAQHMCTDNVNYRGVGSSFAFDPDMVYQTLGELTAGLQMAYDARQERLRAQQYTPWQRLKMMFN